MNKIYIIGNGFDIAHGLKTQYKHFKSYLEDEIRDIYDSIDFLFTPDYIPDIAINHIHAGIGDRSRVIQNLPQEMIIVYWLIYKAANKSDDLEWNQFEDLLIELEWNLLLNKSEMTEDNISALATTAVDIKGFFFRWINTIDLNKITIKKHFNKIIDSQNDIFISFNYTETLEKAYYIEPDNVVHIHGKRCEDENRKKELDMLSIGDNNSELIVGSNLDRILCDGIRRQYDEHKRFHSIDNGLIKDTEAIIFSHGQLWDSISHKKIDNIYSVGFSFSDVDMPYVAKICEVINTTQTTWNLNDYEDAAKREGYKKRIRKAGFKGEFCLWNMEHKL